MHSKEAPASASRNCIFGGIAPISFKLRLPLTDAKPAIKNCVKQKLREQLRKNSLPVEEAKAIRELLPIFEPKRLKVKVPSFPHGEQAGQLCQLAEGDEKSEIRHSSRVHFRA